MDESANTMGSKGPLQAPGCGLSQIPSRLRLITGLQIAHEPWLNLASRLQLPPLCGHRLHAHAACVHEAPPWHGRRCQGSLLK